MNLPFHVSGASRMPFLYLSICFIGGVVAAPYLGVGYYWGLGGVIGLLALYLFLFLLGRGGRNRSLKKWLGVVGLGGLFMAGYVRFLQQDPTCIRGHFMHVINDLEGYEGVIVKDLGSKWNKKDVIVSVKQVKLAGVWSQACGRVKVSLPGDKLKGFAYGKVLHIMGRPKSMGKPSNPYEVDYNSRWRGQGVFHEHQVNSFSLEGEEVPSFFVKWGLTSRLYLRSLLRDCFKDEQSCGVALALLLGDRSMLSGEVRDIFVGTGVMHVLAISGMHIALLYALLLFVFSFLGGFIGRSGKYRGVVVFLLWGYALITGFSPSVLRAVGMLSLMVCGRWFERDYNVLNGLGVVSFFMLLYNPYLLFDLGFQLSFAAVLGIMLFYRPIVGLLRSERIFVRYFWQMTAVSLAAQLGTIPISLYYFHFFPTYFLLGNWLMLPWVPVLFSLGMLVLLFGWWPWGAGALAWVFEKVVGLTTFCLGWLESLPYAHIGPFWPSFWVAVAWYALLGALFVGFKKRSFLWLCLATTLVCGLGALSIYRNVKCRDQQILIVYDVGKHSVVGMLQGRSVMLVSDKVLSKSTSYYKSCIKPSLEAFGIRKSDQAKLGSEGDGLYDFGGKHVLIADRHQGFSVSVPTSSIDVLVVCGDSIQDLTPWLSKYSVDMLVIGNSHGAPDQLLLQADAYGVPSHVVRDKGAYVMHIS